MKDRAAVLFPPPVMALLTVLGGYWLKRAWPIDVGFTISPTIRYSIGGLIVVGAVTTGLWSVYLFRKSGQDESPFKPTPQIVQRWPYSVSRNPMYLQLLVLCLAGAVIDWNVWIIFLTPVFALGLYWAVIRPEEIYLEEKFGEEYSEYKTRVRRWL